jgi:hypothetical protein
MARATGRSLVTECLRDTHPGGGLAALEIGLTDDEFGALV